MITIRPAYRRGEFVGFSLYTTEPIGRVFASYKSAAMELARVRKEIDGE